MSRVRLTARGRSAADQTPYPGNVNQPDRQDPDWDQYHTFEQKTNHELPDMRHDWQNDGRDDIGFGIPEEWGKSPTVASVRVAATKAVRVAVLLLGEKVEDEVIEAQAKDFMSMGTKAMDRTLQRFADTQQFYADDDADEDDEKVEEVKVEAKQAATEAEFKPEIAVPGSEEQPKVAEDKAEDKKEDKPVEKVEEEKKAADKVEEKVEDTVKASDVKAMIASAVAEAMKAALPDFIQKKVDEKKEKEDDKKASDDAAKTEEKVEDEKKAAAADEAAEEVVEKAEDKVEAKKSAATAQERASFDIELTGAMDDEVAPDPEADERLASLFDDQSGVTAGTSDRKVEASQKKAGIKKLGGQPRVVTASDGGVDISSIWQSAPDVSEAFK